MASASPITVSGTIIPKQIDYAVRDATTAPVYKMMKIPLNNFSSFPIAIEPTGSRVLEWKLPTQVYNLAKSYISYGINMAAPVAASARFNCHFENCFDLGNQITFGAASGNNLCDLSFLQCYTKVARSVDTTFDDYIGNSNLSGLYKCNSVNAANPLPATWKYTGVSPYTAVDYAPADNFIEPKYFLAPAAVETQSFVFRQFPLSGITNTIFSVDKDVYFGPQEQYLRITAGTGQKMGFTTTSLSVPGTAAAVAGAVGLNDVYLYLAIEQNPNVRDSVLALAHTGALKMRIPFTTAFKNLGSSQNTQTNIGISFSQQYGKRLRRILHSVWHPTESSNTGMDNSNFNGSKILNFNTFLDSQVLQDRIMDCRQPAGNSIFMDDWAENRKYADKKVVLSKEMYQLNWYHIDQFFSPPDDDNSLPPSNLDEGLAKNTAKQWLFSGLAGGGQTPANLVHYTFATFDREILITPNGPIWI